MGQTRLESPEKWTKPISHHVNWHAQTSSYDPFAFNEINEAPTPAQCISSSPLFLSPRCSCSPLHRPLHAQTRPSLFNGFSPVSYGIKQKEGKLIRAFVNCFNVVTLEICDLDQSTAMAVIVGGLLKNDLKKLLTKTYLRNFSDMLACTEKYVRTEEAFALEISINSVAVRQSKEHSPR